MFEEEGPGSRRAFSLGTMQTMQELDVPEAIAFNKAQDGPLWIQEALPWPLSMRVMGPFVIAVDTKAFVTTVAMFQGMHGLLPDGKLGAATYALMKSMETVVPESTVAHDFEVPEEDDEDEDPAFGSAKPQLAPARGNVSNCLIIAGKSVSLPDAMLRLGITASNYIDDGEKHFDQNRKRTEVTHFVIHESVTMSAAQTNRVLDAKRRKSGKKGRNKGNGWDFGIHLNLAPDGHISCHADLVFERLVHAEQLNSRSAGIEVVNPYNPRFGRGPFTETIPGPWWCWKPQNGKRVYTLPTPAQLCAIYPLCEFVCEQIPTIPLMFPTASLNKQNTRIDGWKDGKRPAPGIVAHRDFASHADGRYLLEHAYAQWRKVYAEGLAADSERLAATAAELDGTISDGLEDPY